MRCEFCNAKLAKMSTRCDDCGAAILQWRAGHTSRKNRARMVAFGVDEYALQRFENELAYGKAQRIHAHLSAGDERLNLRRGVVLTEHFISYHTGWSDRSRVVLPLQAIAQVRPGRRTVPTGGRLPIQIDIVTIIFSDGKQITLNCATTSEAMSLARRLNQNEKDY